MPVAVLRSLWSKLRQPKDPYEEFYLQAAPADPRNFIVNRIREAPDGSVFAVKAETHTPEIMASHVKELGRFFGADLVHIADARKVIGAEPATGDASAGPDLPFAVFCLFRSEHDGRDAPGIGGNVAALKGAFATFQLSAIIREFGYDARRSSHIDGDSAAALAGLGTLDARGRLNSHRFGTRVHVADVILTDLPVASD
jgi:hypothetical protein